MEPKKKHCRHGHELTPENVRWLPNGKHWRCRKCVAANARRHFEKHKERVLAQRRARAAEKKASAESRVNPEG